jgi:hypothetical protein
MWMTRRDAGELEKLEKSTMMRMQKTRSDGGLREIEFRVSVYSSMQPSRRRQLPERSPYV